MIRKWGNLTGKRFNVPCKQTNGSFNINQTGKTKNGFVVNRMLELELFKQRFSLLLYQGPSIRFFSLVSGAWESLSDVLFASIIFLRSRPTISTHLSFVIGQRPVALTQHCSGKFTLKIPFYFHLFYFFNFVIFFFFINILVLVFFPFGCLLHDYPLILDSFFLIFWTHG